MIVILNIFVGFLFVLPCCEDLIIEQLNFYYIRVQAQKLFFLANILEELGVDKRQVLTNVVDLPNSTTDFEATVSGKELIQVYQNIARLALPGIGLKIGTKLRTEHYGLFGCTLMCHKTTRDSLLYTTKYHSLVTRTTKVYYQEYDDNTGFLGCEDILGHPELTQFNLELQVAIHLNLIRDATNDNNFSPQRVLLSFTEPSHSELYYQLFDCPVLFDQAVTGFEFSNELLNIRQARYNPLALPLLLKASDQQLEHLGRDRFLQGVYTWISNHLGSELVSDALAKHLCITARTLRRHLADHGTSFNKICAEVKCRFAKKYIDDDKLSIDDIASALGFNDSANFRRAFKSWTGLTPSEYRRDCHNQDLQWSKS